MVSHLLNSRKTFLFTLVLIVQGVFYFKFLAIPLLVMILFNFSYQRKIEIDSIAFFYIGIIFVGFISYLIELVRNGFGFNAAVLVFLSLFLWLVYLLIYLMIKSWVLNKSKVDVEWVILTFFKLNAFLCLIQYFLMVFEFKSLNPFSTELGTSAGDFIKGFFANSSVNMIVCAFYSIYFLTKKQMKLFGLSVVIILFTSYMSGVLIYILAFLLFFLFNKNVKGYTKLVSLILFLIGGGIFYFVSFDNIVYAYSIIESVFTLSPPRKIVSFVQTYEFLKSDYLHLLFGASPAHFSSRFAFIGGGEFVNWYPSFLTFRSTDFNLNHFQLWNFDVLSIPFNDGTGNQPFSFYNQLFGEYGLIGFFVFIFFYVNGVLKKVKHLDYALMFVSLLMMFFVLDYWYEYLASMIIFEMLIISLNKSFDTKQVIPV